MAAALAPHPDELFPWDALPGMVLLLDASGAARQVNAAFAAFCGEAPRALLGHGWQRLLAGDALAQLHDVLSRGGDFQLRWQVGHADGRTGWLDCTASWVAGAQRCLCLLHDVTEGTDAQATAQAQAGLFRLLADNVPVLIAYYRASDFQCQFANKAYAQAFGWDELSIVGQPIGTVIGAAAMRNIQPYVDRLLNAGEAAAYERQLKDAEGRSRWLDVNLLPHTDSDGAVVGAFVLISDISKHRHAEQALRESEERLAKFMQASAEGIVFHQDGVITDANPPLCELIGYTLDEMRGRRTLDFIAPDQVATVTAVMASGQETAYESVLIDKNGQRVAVEFIVRTMLRNGERMRMTIVRDIRDRQAAQARIHHLAHHDALTGLPNRSAFMDGLARLMAGTREGTACLALLFIDLDHFKRVNDSLGHLVGDTLLRTVAARIVACLRTTDIVARFGGDEFMVLLPGMSADEQHGDVSEVAQKLLAAIEVPVHAEGRPISVTPSIGIALFPGDGDSPDELVKHADSAMYLAKARGRANYQFFEPSMAVSAYAALVMEGQLTLALQRGEFELYYQPQVRASDGGLVGAEALIRWNHPERGLLLPDEFIALAERQRVMLPIGLWVLREAARCTRSWHERGLVAAPVSVNLSTVQFEAAGFVDAVGEVLSEAFAGADPGWRGGPVLELELTERMLMADLGEVKQRLARLKAMGLRISVDDFGTGYSSLGHLKELPIDKVKIDRSFVHDLPGNRDSVAIARAIIQMSLSLGLTVMAEGVENEAQRDFLAENHCDELQGSWVGLPMPVPAFEAWVRARRG